MSVRSHEIEERAGGLFEPDTLLPSQYFDRLRGRGGESGERRLMVAVLEDAVNVYVKHAGAPKGRAQRLFEEAEEWFQSPDGTWTFSFESICDVLGLEPDYIRRGLRAWKVRVQGARVELVTPSGAPDRLASASGE